MNKSSIRVGLLCLIALILYLKASDDPILPFLSGTYLEPMFLRFDVGNSILKDLSIGILVSTIFWYFNVHLPSQRTRLNNINRLNRALKLILEANDGNPYHWDKHYIHCKPLGENDLETIKNIRLKIESGEIYNSLAEKTFYETCNESYEIFRFLSIAANEISSEHGGLWDSLTRNITQIGKFQPEYQKKKIESGWEFGDKRVDFSQGKFRLNMIEIMEKLEKWIKLK